jgi:predicted TIM-barrel fold metal-dependent hydrolase
MRDRIGVKLCHEVGIKNMAWSSDFPHHGNDWPNSQRVFSALVGGLDVTREERERLMWRNAAKVWKIEI